MLQLSLKLIMRQLSYLTLWLTNMQLILLK